MTSNPLNQRRYAVNAVVADVGWITDQEKDDVATIIEDGVVHFTSDLQQLHLYWALLADTMSSALEEAKTTLRRAVEATGVACPRTRSFHVDEAGQ